MAELSPPPPAPVTADLREFFKLVVAKSGAPADIQGKIIQKCVDACSEWYIYNRDGLLSHLQSQPMPQGIPASLHNYIRAALGLDSNVTAIGQPLPAPTTPPRKESAVEIGRSNMTPGLRGIVEGLERGLHNLQFQQRSRVTVTTASQFHAHLHASHRLKDGLQLKELDAATQLVKDAARLIVAHRLFDQEEPLASGKARRLRYTPIQRGASEASLLQPRFSAVIKYLFDNLKLLHTLVDSHKYPSIGSAKPDGTAYGEGQPHCVYYMSFLLDIKSISSKVDEFSDASLGSVMLFLMELKRFQPHRVQLYGAVTDCRMIQFVRAEGTDPEQLHFTVGPVMPLLDAQGAPSTGLRTLLALLSDSQQLSAMPELRWDNTTLKVDRYLGAGSSACVFSATIASSPAERVVVKMFREASVDDYNRELVTLQRLSNNQELSGRLTRLAPQHTQAPVRVLYLWPVGLRLALTVADCSSAEDNETAVRATPQMLAFAVSTLHFLHKARVAHRDVRPNNMFLNRSTGQLFLNDLGSSAEIGSVARFAGALYHAPDDVIRSHASGATYTPEGWHDLVMLVWTAFELAFPVFWCEVHKHGAAKLDKKSANLIIATREAFVLESSVWLQLLEVAKAGQYDELATAFERSLPRFYPGEPQRRFYPGEPQRS